MWRERRFSGISVTKSANEGTFGGSVAGLYSDSYASNITEQSVWTSLNNHPRIMIHEKTSRLLQPNDKKILFLVLDGLGGLPRPETGKTEIETANIPNLDGLAGASSGGRARHSSSASRPRRAPPGRTSRPRPRRPRSKPWSSPSSMRCRILWQDRRPPRGR